MGTDWGKGKGKATSHEALTWTRDTDTTQHGHAVTDNLKKIWILHGWDMAMEGRRWEDLSMDCLVNVFGRVGMESLISDIPFVCKSWYKATLNPLCWQQLIFPKLSPDRWCFDPFTSRLKDKYQVGDDLCVTSFIKFVINRSQGSAIKIELPNCCTEEALVYVAEACPALKVLLLPSDIEDDQMSKLPDLICKWKNLECLRLSNIFNMLQEILGQISIHCKNLVALGVPGAFIGKDEASAIVNLLPNIKFLALRNVFIERENLVTILQGCRELVLFDVRDCIGFEEDDEILKLASHIRTFKYEGSRWDDYEDKCNYRDDGFHDGYISD